MTKQPTEPKKKDLNRYLSDEQIDEFDQFLRDKKISYAEVSRILYPRTPAAIGYYFKEKAWKIEDFKRVKKELEDRANSGFDKIDFKF